MYEHLRDFGCCSNSRFGWLLWKLVPGILFALAVRGWNVRKLAGCHRPVVAVSWYGGPNDHDRISQCWCEKHMPHPHKNYLGEEFRAMLLD